MKKLYLILFFLSLSLVSEGQTTTVTATVLYPDANTFANGTVLATFTPPGGIIDQNLYLLNGAAFPYYVSGNLDGTGTFTITLTDDHKVSPQGGRWMFTVCSAATVPCTNSLQDVFGSSINLSTLISASVSPIFASATNFPIYFSDSEVKTNTYGGLEYFNYVTATFRCWNGSTWSNCSSGGGGGGGVTNFAAGNLVPIFTTTVSNPTTSPLLNFILTNAPANTVLANETGSNAAPSYSTDALTINTTSPLGGGGSVSLGGSITLTCSTCSIPQVSITASSPIVVTPSPITGTGVISCPTCGTSTGTVTDFTSGNLSPLFTTGVTNGTTTPALSFTLDTAGADLVFANCTNSTASPSFCAINTTMLPVVTLRRVCIWGFGANDAASALVDADISPQVSQRCYIPYAGTVKEIMVTADAGTPSVMPAVNHLGSDTNILSVALATAASGGRACSNVGGTTSFDGSTTCLNTLSSTSIAAGDYLEPNGGVAGGTAKAFSVAITFQVN